MDKETNNAEVEGATSELTIPAAVVSVSAIFDAAARLEGVRRLTVRCNAIVTPAARDLLRERKIELAYRDSGAATAASGNSESMSLRLVVAAVGTAVLEVDALVKLLARMPIGIERLVPAGLVESIDELANHVAGQHAQRSTIGVLLTSESAAAACLANRLPGVRAMTVGDGGSLAALTATARAIGANLLIVNPAGRSPFAMKPWIERFCQGAPRACPPKWRGRLD